MTQLVNIKHEDYDVYIGRGYDKHSGVKSKWGNPYTHIIDKETLAEFIVGTRDEAIEKYSEYIQNNQELMNSLDELEGKILGCWCSPKSCHGDVLIKLLAQKKLKKVFKK